MGGHATIQKINQPKLSGFSSIVQLLVKFLLKPLLKRNTPAAVKFAPPLLSLPFIIKLIVGVQEARLVHLKQGFEVLLFFI